MKLHTSCLTVPALAASLLLVGGVVRAEGEKTTKSKEIASFGTLKSATLEAANIDADGPSTIDGEDQELLARYVDAFERYDITSLVTLLHEDATFTMPPHPRS